VTEPYEPESIAHVNGRRVKRRSPRQVFVDEALNEIAKASRGTNYGLSGLQRQRACEAAYDYILECGTDYDVDGRVGKRLVREAMRPRNGLAAVAVAPIVWLLAAILWDVIFYWWTHRK
jgi:hypothetical protein